MSVSAVTVRSDPDRETGIPAFYRRVRRATVRQWGEVLLPLLFAEGALGVASVGESAGATPGLLAAHVALGLSLVAAATLALSVGLRSPSMRSRGITIATVIGVYATATTGAIFLATQFGSGLVIDRGLGIFDILGSAGMILWGAAPPAAAGP